MKVFKFGGASINSVERIRNVGSIVKQHQNEKLLLVISAMGKTTNALEKVVNAFHAGKKTESLELFEKIKKDHLDLAKQILPAHFTSCEAQLKNYFTEVEWLLHDKPVRDYDYYYDQVVCTGELFSSTIVSQFLNESGVANTWIDVRDILRTDDNFRDANIQTDHSSATILKEILPLFESNRVLMTQGFIAATDENESTTLGREGSDYSAALFANMLNADSLTIWKDVEAVMNADPRQFSDARPIPELNYDEVIEMAYYGAQVIHPKTVKPLQNKNIPLFVKSFLAPSLPGTQIHNKSIQKLPPIIVLKENQVMLEMSSRDFSFIGEQHVGHLYQLLQRSSIRPNLTQNTAISFICVLDDKPDKIEKLALAAAEFLDIKVSKGFSLLTLRHYEPDLFLELTRGRKILLRQQTTETIQVLMQEEK